MQLFSALAPLEIVAIDVLGQVLTTKKGKPFLSVNTDHLYKLIKTVPLTYISTGTIAKSYVDF